jgi:hypothetical protein
MTGFISMAVGLALAASTQSAYAAPVVSAESTPLSGTVQAALKTQKPKWRLSHKCKDSQAKILFKAGFNKPGLLRGAYAITWRESNHQALDESSPWYSGALGTWQIQTSAWSGRSWWSRSNMLDKYTQSRIVKKHFLKGGMHNWGLGYSEKRDEWYFDTGMYDALWGASGVQSMVIAPYQRGYARFPSKCTPVYK